MDKILKFLVIVLISSYLLNCYLTYRASLIDLEFIAAEKELKEIIKESDKKLRCLI